MRLYIAFILLTSLSLLRCSSPYEGQPTAKPQGAVLPRVLFVTSGMSGDNAQMPHGVVVAVQELTRKGAVVSLEPRDILFDPDRLCQYNIVILSTFPGYHDADRKYSLTYMSDFELANLQYFVSQGGVIVSGDNVGRNFPDGTDRIVRYGELTPENWILSDCYGLSLTERNMTGYDINGEIAGYSKWQVDNASLRGDYTELWTLVPDSLFSKKIEVLGYWKNGPDSVPAIIKNEYEEGMAFLLSSSAFLHPANEGGHWGLQQIERFYDYVFDEYNDTKGLNVTLNPWPDGHEQAFCVTLNSAGSLDQYKRLLRLLEEENIDPTIFVNGKVDEEIMVFLKSGGYALQSSGYSYLNYKGKGYPWSLDDILQNESYWDIDFSGFRFPYTNPGYWGLMALNESGYLFESSIGANNLDFIHGSVHPYNIVISNNGFFVSTDILEIAPSYHDDYYFLKAVHGDKASNQGDVDKEAKIYSKYLENYWEYAVKPYHGLMVFLGHPLYTGYSDATTTPLMNLVSKVKEDDTWITTIEEAAGFRKNIADLRFFVDKDDEVQHISVVTDNDVQVRKVCLNVMGKVRSASAIRGDVQISEKDDVSQLIFDAFNGQVISVNL